MIKERAWPAKAMYILIAAALAISLIIMAAPAQKLSAADDDDFVSEWDRVATPTTDGWVLAPNSTIFDYALASAGEVAYAVVYSDYEGGYFLLKSDDYAATWDDITDALEDELATGENITELRQVATDWDNPDFVAVALNTTDATRPWQVFVSTDGGDTFEAEPGEVEDGVWLVHVSDLAVSYEDDGEREIAIGGQDNNGDAALFRCTVDGDSIGTWKDAADHAGNYPGWDNMWFTDSDFSDDLDSDWVTDIIFSPNWDEDKTVLVTTINEALTGSYPYYDVYVQSGTWGTSAGWNEKSTTLGIPAVAVLEDVRLPTELATWDARAIAGITLPEDYTGEDTEKRVFWVWVNYFDDDDDPACAIRRIYNASAGSLGEMGQIIDGKIWLTNVSYQGDIDDGEAIAGVLGTGGYAYGYSPMELLTACCEGVDVYHNSDVHNMIICCDPWVLTCKPPTGRAAMAVSYVGDDKAYAVALQGIMNASDESAWSVTFDDGHTWNQLSLVDTHIDYLSDVAVSPDCNKTMLVSVNIHKVCIDYMNGEPRNGEPTDCDSVWLHADELFEAPEYDDQWLRTWCGRLEGENNGDFPDFVTCNFTFNERGLLRLNPEEEEGDEVRTVFLVDRMSGNVYWDDLETLGCWDPISSTEITSIVDLAVLDADTIFALGANGKVAMFDDGDWEEAVDSEVDDGWTIAVWGDHILVGGQEGDVSYSDDGGETFEALEDVVDVDAYVTVAFDTYFDTNSVIYAALAGASVDNGIYRFVIGESDVWVDLRADTHDYTGLVLDRPGNPFTDDEKGGVIYASYVGSHTAHVGSGCDTDMTWYTGVARRLYPAEQVICGECGEWDYLTLGLSEKERFNMSPDALKICGCLMPDTNSKLFAIDGSCEGYDMEDYQTGSVWTFEDCYGKKAPEITHPIDGQVIPADPCSCYSIPFTLTWLRLCDACSYGIEFALDPEFTMLVEVNGKTPEQLADLTISGETPSFSILGGEDGGLSCETTYYVQVRASNAENCQIIHSWWSPPIEFTIAPSVEAGIVTLIAPAPGALNQPIKNLGFSWDLLATADTFDWVLSENADLSSPLDSKSVTSKATTYANTLEYGTTYYWQVEAKSEGALVGTSAIGTFTTAAQGAFCCPECGLCFDTQAELEAHIADAHEAADGTPPWVWVVIAIGAVLVIVVIVLIFRTRRV
jgi:hypothetical protein